MFDSLDEQMKLDDRKTSSARDRLLVWGLAGVGVIVVFGGIVLAIHYLPG